MRCPAQNAIGIICVDFWDKGTVLLSHFPARMTIQPGQKNRPRVPLAVAVMTAIPEITAYLCMQKNFEKGMSAGALK